jgi:hypothetical protein
MQGPDRNAVWVSYDGKTEPEVLVFTDRELVALARAIAPHVARLEESVVQHWLATRDREAPEEAK